MTEEKERTTDPALRKLKEKGPTIVKIALGVAACLPAFVSYLGATSDARQEAQAAAHTAKGAADKATAVVETKAKAGYEVTRQELELVKLRLSRLERALKAAKMPVKQAPPAPPSPLPATLEKAVEQVKAPPSDHPAKPVE